MTPLVLIPTERERRTLEPILASPVRRADGLIELCGFGPIAAAARTMQLIAMHQPKQVILVGIAGSLRPELEVGTAHSFRQVRCDGIGAGTGADHKSAGEIGWQHWSPVNPAPDQGYAGVGDVIPLAPRLIDTWKLSGELLTVCAASANEAEAAMRVERYPDSMAEDMEGFGVAMACYFGAVPLQIIRGISNRAGDRDQRNWKIEEALQAAGQLTIKALPA